MAQQIWGCVWRAGVGVGEWGRRGGEATTAKQCWTCHCQKDTSWMFHPFVWIGAGVRPRRAAPRVSETWATVLGDNPERTAPLSQATGSEWEGRHTLIHKCLLHALNGCGLWWIFSPDALSMRLTLCIIASAQTERALSPISLFSASLN